MTNWVKVRNPTTGGEATVAESSLGELARAGWVQADDKPPAAPKAGPAGKAAAAAGNSNGEQEGTDQ